MANMIARVANLLLSPKAEWDVIDAEAVEPRKLIFGYVAPLVALPAAATVIGLAVLGVDVGRESVRAPWMWVIASALLFFALAVLAVVVFAYVLDAFAPLFGASRNFAQALKVSGYSPTAAMVAGVATIVPALGVVALIGAAYSLYLLFIATPKLMKPPPESALNYSIAATASAIGIALVVGLAAMATIAPSARVLFPQLVSLPSLPPKPGAAASPAPTPLPVAIPAASAAGASSPAAPGAPAGAAPASPGPPPLASSSGLVSPTALKSLAPEKLAGLDRVSLGVAAESLAGAPPSVSLDAEYRKGNRLLDLTISHSPQIAAIAGFGGPNTSEYDRETAEGYSRRQRAGADFISEEWDKASQTGSYARVSNGQFLVRAQGGGGVTAGELKQAVESFAPDMLAKLEHTP